MEAEYSTKDALSMGSTFITSLLGVGGVDLSGSFLLLDLEQTFQM